MGKDPAVLFFISDWLTSTSEMDADVRGWYLNLLLHNYDKGSLPNDIEKLAVLAGVKFSEYKRFEQVFEQVFKHKFEQTPEQRLSNPRTNEILRQRENFKEKRSESGKLSYFLKYLRSKHGAELRKKRFEKFVKDNADLLSEIDLKNEHMLEHLFEHLFELYRIENESKNINWKKDFNIYLSELKIAYQEIVKDESLITEQRKFYPNIDILLTLEKSYTNFWATEAGWKNKKKARTVNIDWRATFINSLAQKMNHVYSNNNNNGTPKPSKNGSYD